MSAFFEHIAFVGLFSRAAEAEFELDEPGLEIGAQGNEPLAFVLKHASDRFYLAFGQEQLPCAVLGIIRRHILWLIRRDVGIHKPRLAATDQDLRRTVDQWAATGSSPAPRFVSPGVNSLSAARDLARSVIRRTERSMVILQEIGQLQRAEALKYVNRLGCLLYILARYAEKSPN